MLSNIYYLTLTPLSTIYVAYPAIVDIFDSVSNMHVLLLIEPPTILDICNDASYNSLPITISFVPLSVVFKTPYIGIPNSFDGFNILAYPVSTSTVLPFAILSMLLTIFWVVPLGLFVYIEYGFNSLTTTAVTFLVIPNNLLKKSFTFPINSIVSSYETYSSDNGYSSHKIRKYNISAVSGRNIFAYIYLPPEKYDIEVMWLSYNPMPSDSLFISKIISFNLMFSVLIFVLSLILFIYDCSVILIALRIPELGILL